MRILDVVGIILITPPIVIVGLVIVGTIWPAPTKPSFLPLPSGVRIMVTDVPDGMVIPGERQHFRYGSLVDADRRELVGPNIMSVCFNDEAVEGYAYDWVWPRGEGWRENRYFIHRRGDDAATIIDKSVGVPYEKWQTAIDEIAGKPCRAKTSCMLSIRYWPAFDRLAFERAERLRGCGQNPAGRGAIGG